MYRSFESITNWQRCDLLKIFVIPGWNMPTTQCWHVSPRRGESERQKYFRPGRQKYLSALVSPLWAETSQLFTYTALFGNTCNSRFGIFFTLHKLAVGQSMGIGWSEGLHHSPASKGLPIKALSSCCSAIFSQLV